MDGRAAIIPDMPIFGSDGALVGTVDRVSPTRILVNHVGASDADDFAIPLARVASVTDRVTLDCPAEEARAADAVSDTRRSRLPIWLAVGLIGVGLVYGSATLIRRGGPAPHPSASAPVAAPAPPPLVPAAAAAPVAASPRSDVPAAATQTSLASYLGSSLPTGQAFTLDDAFSGNGATLGDAGNAQLRGLAAVMAAHPNAQIKLAATGALGLRRVATIREALVGWGVADYRIATGPARLHGHDGPGVALIVLAK